MVKYRFDFKAFLGEHFLTPEDIIRETGYSYGTIYNIHSTNEISINVLRKLKEIYGNNMIKKYLQGVIK